MVIIPRAVSSLELHLFISCANVVSKYRDLSNRSLYLLLRYTLVLLRYTIGFLVCSNISKFLCYKCWSTKYHESYCLHEPITNSNMTNKKKHKTSNLHQVIFYFLFFASTVRRKMVRSRCSDRLTARRWMRHGRV